MIFKALVNCSAKSCTNDAYILLNSDEGPPGIVQIIAPDYHPRGTDVEVENTPQNAKKFVDGHISKWEGYSVRKESRYVNCLFCVECQEKNIESLLDPENLREF